jgi:hypothetical protein
VTKDLKSSVIMRSTSKMNSKSKLQVLVKKTISRTMRMKWMTQKMKSVNSKRISNKSKNYVSNRKRKN